MRIAQGSWITHRQSFLSMMQAAALRIMLLCSLGVYLQPKCLTACCRCLMVVHASTLLCEKAVCQVVAVLKMQRGQRKCGDKCPAGEHWCGH